MKHSGQMQSSFHLNLREVEHWTGEQEKKEGCRKGLGFNFGTTDTWFEAFFVVRRHRLVHCRIYSGTPGLRGIRQQHHVPPSCDNQNVSRLCQMFLGMEEKGHRKTRLRTTVTECGGKEQEYTLQPPVSFFLYKYLAALERLLWIA